MQQWWNTTGPKRNYGDGIGEPASMLNKQHKITIQMDGRVRGKRKFKRRRRRRNYLPTHGSQLLRKRFVVVTGRVLCKHHENHMENDDDIRLPFRCVFHVIPYNSTPLLQSTRSSIFDRNQCGCADFLLVFFSSFFVLALRPKEPASQQ